MAIEIDIQKQAGDFVLEVHVHSQENRIGFLGASGCGKTMTLKCIAGIEEPDEGRIIVDGRVLFDKAQKIRIPPQQRKVGYLFQNYALFPNMTVEQNIAVGISASKKEKRERTKEMMERFRLQGLGKLYPSELSGGQQQRTALARILASEPEAILLDEPYSALDGYLKEQMQQEMKTLLKNYPGTVILVTHSRDEVYRFSQDLLIMSQGKSVCSGSTKALFQNPGRVEAARLTGCKNLSPIQKLGPHEILALEWNLYLHTAQEVGDAAYVGIRAHDLRPGIKGEENTYEMDLADVMDAPFEQVFQVRKKQADKDGKLIWWKKDKNLDWDREEERFPRYLTFPKERLLLLK